MTDPQKIQAIAREVQRAAPSETVILDIVLRESVADGNGEELVTAGVPRARVDEARAKGRPTAPAGQGRLR